MSPSLFRGACGRFPSSGCPYRHPLPNSRTPVGAFQVPGTCFGVLPERPLPARRFSGDHYGPLPQRVHRTMGKIGFILVILSVILRDELVKRSSAPLGSKDWDVVRNRLGRRSPDASALEQRTGVGAGTDRRKGSRMLARWQRLGGSGLRMSGLGAQRSSMESSKGRRGRDTFDRPLVGTAGWCPARARVPVLSHAKPVCTVPVT